MLKSETRFELDKFLDRLEMIEAIYIVVAGAVFSGQYLKTEDRDIINMSNASVHTGGSITEVQDILIPKEQVIAWGYKEDQE